MALKSYLQSALNPRKVPGLESWWDAADAASVTLDAGRVSQLADKSGNGRHLTNTTSGSTQPSYITAGRNGLNVARFAAASVQRLSVPSSTATYKFLHDGTPCYWIAVSSYGDSSNPNATLILFATNSTASAQVGFWYAFEDTTADGGNNGISYQVSRGVTASLAAAAYNGVAYPAAMKNIITPQTLTVQECLLDASNATASNRAGFIINGGSSINTNTFTNAVSASNAAGNLTVGATAANALPMTGDVCELMFFSQQPTPAARDLIRRYLGSKWGVTVA
jgi:hypothetical protein